MTVDEIQEYITKNGVKSLSKNDLVYAFKVFSITKSSKDDTAIQKEHTKAILKELKARRKEYDFFVGNSIANKANMQKYNKKD